MKNIKTIDDLIRCYKTLPGIGSKTAERLAYATLQLSKEERDDFISSFIKCNDEVKICDKCGFFYEGECPICNDPKREHSSVMIVSNSKDVLTIDNTEEYNGLYFILKGTISPLKNITAQDIGLDKLEKYIAQNNCQEIILALPTNIEGETTSLYITNMFKDSSLNISRLASGIPLGTNLEYIDNMTISRSIKDRIFIKGVKDE